MKVFIIGIAGGVGRRLAQQLAATGDQPIGLVRRPEQAEALASDGIQTVSGDLVAMSVEHLAAAMRGYRMVLTYDDPSLPGKSGGHRDVVDVRFVEVDPPSRMVEAVGEKYEQVGDAARDAFDHGRDRARHEFGAQVDRPAPGCNAFRCGQGHEVPAVRDLCIRQACHERGGRADQQRAIHVHRLWPAPAQSLVEPPGPQEVVGQVLFDGEEGLMTFQTIEDGLKAGWWDENYLNITNEHDAFLLFGKGDENNLDVVIVDTDGTVFKARTQPKGS